MVGYSIWRYVKTHGIAKCCTKIYVPEDSAIGVALTAVDSVLDGVFQANVFTFKPAARRASILVSSCPKGLPFRDFDFFFGFSLICFNQLSIKSLWLVRNEHKNSLLCRSDFLVKFF